MYINTCQLLADLYKSRSSVREAFADLFGHEVEAIPIPFFGDIENAKIITIGLNPSDGEFANGRWPKAVDPEMLNKRLINYFQNTTTSRHDWFKTWEEALAELQVSYSDGTAAHIDICPWPTRPMFGLPIDRSTKLLTENLPWFWQTIRLAKNTRLLLMAGAVNKRRYIHRFLAETAKPTDIMFKGRFTAGGLACIRDLDLFMDGINFPVFFCSVSPSSWNRQMLAVRVRENKARLLKFITKTPPA